MSNKTIAILDLINFNDQCIETLVFANILEKKYDTCAVLDLNIISGNKFLDKENIKWTKEGEISKAKLFDNSLYHILNKMPETKNKLVNMAKSLKKSNEILLINMNPISYKDNSNYFDLANEIVVFANFKHSLPQKILKLFLQQPIKNKKVYLIFYGYEENVQNAKAYINMLKCFQYQKIELIKINSSPDVNSLKDIASIDPWKDIYKIINSKF